MTQDPAFEMVKSLTPNEKRFFRLYSGEEKNYLYVFDALDSMEEYDGAVLKKKLKKRNLNISYEKNYLSKQILKVLRNINSVDAPMLRANNLLADVELLFSKKLFLQALQKINEAKEMAWRFDFFGIYLELLSIQKRILILFPDPEIEKVFQKLEEEQDAGLRMINNLFEFVAVNSRLHSMAMARGGLLGKKDVAEFDKRARKGMLDDPESAFSPTAKMLFYSNKLGRSFFSGDHKNALKANNECILTIEKYPSLFEKNPQNYVALVSNSCIIMLNNGQFQEARHVLTKLRTLDKTFEFKLSQAILADIFESSMKLEIAIATESGTIENISGLTREITMGLEQYKKGISEYDRLVISYYLAIINYFDEKTATAQRILNDIVNASSKELGGDYYQYSKLLLALLHFEKGNFELAKKLVKNLKKDSDGLISLISGFINAKQNQVESPKERKKVIERFRVQAEEWSKQNKPLMFFPLIKWLDKIR